MKKMRNPRWRPRNGCDGRLMVKILITTIQVNFGAAFGFHIFFHHSLFEGRTLFLQLSCFGLDFTSFCICIPPKPTYGQLWGFFNLSFSFPQEEEKMKQMNTLNISDFINKCTNYIYNTYIYYRTLHGEWFLCN